MTSESSTASMWLCRQGIVGASARSKTHSITLSFLLHVFFVFLSFRTHKEDLSMSSNDRSCTKTLRWMHPSWNHMLNCCCPWPEPRTNQGQDIRIPAWKTTKLMALDEWMKVQCKVAASRKNLKVTASQVQGCTDLHVHHAPLLQKAPGWFR